MTFPTGSLAARQAQAEDAWLTLTRKRVSAGKMACVCDPDSHGARWSGYLGAAYAEDRVLFVGANHNGTDTGLKATPQMADYNAVLKTWASLPRSPDTDVALLDAMRAAYQVSWPKWLRVWEIIEDIRKATNIADDGFAFVNLALCPDPVVSDAQAIPACQKSFPLLKLVESIDAQVVFVAKDDANGKEAAASIADGNRWIRRYSNAWSGMYQGAPYNVWIERDAAEMRKAIAIRR
jgi:hypothetical protein